MIPQQPKSLFKKVASGAIASLLSCVLISSCTTDYDLFKNAKLAPYNPQLALPLIDDTVTLANIVGQKVNNKNLFINNEGFYYFAYANNYTSPTLEERFVINDQQLANFSIGNGGPVTPTAGTQINGLQTYQVVASTPSDITYIAFKKGILSVVFNSQIPRNCVAELTFQEIINSTTNLPLRAVASLTPNQTTTVTIALAGYKVDRTNSTSALTNLNIASKLGVNDGTGPPSGNNIIGIVANASDIGFSYIQGYLGSFDYQTASAINNVDLKIFDAVMRKSGSNLYFANPTLTADIINYAGLPGKVSIYDITAYTDNVSDGKTLTGTGITELDQNNGVVIPGAAKVNAATNGPSPYNPGLLTKVLDKTNSNNAIVFNFLNILPRNISYTVKAKTEPGARTLSNRSQFGYDTSRVRINTTVTLPMEGYSTRFVLSDTFKVSLPKNDGGKLQQVNKATIKTIITNGFPIAMNVQMVFYDTNMVAIDSLVLPSANSQINGIIATAAPIDAIGRVDQSKATLTTNYFDVPQGRYDNLAAKTTKAVFKALLSTTSANQMANSRMYPDYKMRVQLGVKLDATYDLNK